MFWKHYIRSIIELKNAGVIRTLLLGDALHEYLDLICAGIAQPQAVDHLLE